MAQAAQKLKKNVEGFMDHNGIFHPIRSGKKEQGELYDGQLAGDDDDIFDKIIRQEKNQKKAVEYDEKRQWNEALEGALGEESKTSLSQFVRSSGGLKYDPKVKTNDSGELKNLSFKQTGKRGIAHKNGKYTIDNMREAADQAGYAGIDGLPLRTVSDFLDAIESDLRGKKIYPFGTIGAYKFNPANKKTFWTNKAKHLKRVIDKLRKRNKNAPANKLEKIRKLALELAAKPATAQKSAVTRQKAKRAKMVKVNPVKAKKTPAKKIARKPAKRTAKPKKNIGVITTLAELAVGTSAALGIYDRVKTKEKKPSDSNRDFIGLKDNKGNTDFHEEQFDNALVAIENGNFAKIKTAKLQGKLAGFSANEVDTLVHRARLTSKLRTNPTPATIRSAETSLLKQNGLLKRALARRKAGRLYKRQLRLESALDRAKSKRSAAEKKAKKNPTKPVLTLRIGHYGGNLIKTPRTLKGQGITLYSDGKDTTTGNKTYKVTDRALKKLEQTFEVVYQNKAKSNPAKLKTNRSQSFEAFQGRPTTKTLELPTPDGAPKHLYTLGKLFELRLKGKPDINFRHEVTGKTFYVCADEKNKQLWIAGGKVADSDNSIKAGFSEPYALISHIIYETQKNHLDDAKPTGYIHKFGEEGGRQPTLAFDRNGFPIIAGGSYEITPLGIAD